MKYKNLSFFIQLPVQLHFKEYQSFKTHSVKKDCKKQPFYVLTLLFAVFLIGHSIFFTRLSLVELREATCQFTFSFGRLFLIR